MIGAGENAAQPGIARSKAAAIDLPESPGRAGSTRPSPTFLLPAAVAPPPLPPLLAQPTCTPPPPPMHIPPPPPPAHAQPML